MTAPHLLRALAAFACALLVALCAWRARALTSGGAATAGVIGLLAVLAGWTWAALLVVYFLVTMTVSRFGAARKEARTSSIVAKGGPRDARQVFANGAPFAVAAIGALLVPHPAWTALAGGSLAGSACDTWATEIGTLRGGEPRSILSWRPVPAGSSGGVTGVGTAAGLAGALSMALLCLALGWSHMIAAAVFMGGVAGGLLDSLLGATLQARRRCDACGQSTERLIHSCGAPTRVVGGIAWLDNDAVNLTTTCAAGLLALALAR